MSLIFLLFLIPLILGIWAQSKVSSTYSHYSKIPSMRSITGAQAVAAIMQHSDIDDVKILEIRGHLTDHYDPLRKQLALSSENYHGTSLAAVGVAAHEAGHAIQHKEGYMPLQIRSALIPITNIASQLLPFIVMGGIFLGMFGLIKLGVIAYLVLTVFQLVMLPVEFDASSRAKKQLLSVGILEQDEMPGVVKTLNAAGFTYVAAFVSSLANLMYFLMLSRRND